MLKKASLLLLCLMTNLLLAQNAPFVKGYSVSIDPQYTAHNFRQTSDHGFILSSDYLLSSPDTAGISTYGYLIKLDANGQPIWTIRYPKIACYPSPRDANAVTQTADGGYAIATQQYYCSGNFFGWGVILLIKTDTLGTISWSKSFLGPGICIANCIKQTSDHGFILAGMTRDTLNYHLSYFMIKTDSLGQPQWQKTYHNPYYPNGNGDYGTFFSVIQTHDGGYVACGQGLDPCNQGSVLRLDANGDILWARKCPGVIGYCTDVQETNDHQYIISGMGPDAFGQQYLRIYKMDDLGNTIWARQISVWGWLSSVVVENNGYTFAGSVDGNYLHTAIFHSDTSGNVMWFHTFPQTYQTMNPSIALADSGYAYNFSYNQPNGNNGWYTAMGIVKTDQQGWSSCTMQTPAYTVDTLPPFSPLILYSTTENYSVNTSNIVSESVSLSDTTYCVMTTGIAEALSASSNLSLYPNPTNGNAYLQLPKDGENYQITLYNELGQLIAMLGEATNSTVELPTSGLAAGMYLVRATTENGIHLQIRLIKTE
jgi:hypothetical protein